MSKADSKSQDPRAGLKRQTLETHPDVDKTPAARVKAKRRIEPGDEAVAAPEADSPPVPPTSIRKRKE